VIQNFLLIIAKETNYWVWDGLLTILENKIFLGQNILEWLRENMEEKK